MNTMEPEPVYPEGPHTAEATPNGLIAHVKHGDRVLFVYRGETAWSDAARHAGDLNAKVGT